MHDNDEEQFFESAHDESSIDFLLVFFPQIVFGEGNPSKLSPMPKYQKLPTIIIIKDIVYFLQLFLFMRLIDIITQNGSLFHQDKNHITLT